MLRWQVARFMLAWSAFLLLTSVVPARAGDQYPAKEPKKKRKTWKTTVRVQVDSRYDDNVFLLSGNQKDDLRSAGAAEAASGRFNDMESVIDYVVTPSLKFETEGPGLAGRKFSLQADVGYDFYYRNTQRGHFEIDFSAKQATAKHGRTRFRFEYIPDRFKKNYLVDATDFTGSVEPSERVYRRGNFYQWDLSVDYRHRLLDGRHSSLSGQVGVGYMRRGYDAPFEGRNRTAPYADAEVDIKVNRWWDIDLGYGIAAADSPRRTEVLILDESSFGVDFNGDGDASDIALRTAQLVDRAFTQQRFGISTKFALSRGTDLELGYDRRQRHYSSHEPFDVAHNNRTDKRDAVTAGLTFRLARGFHLHAAYGYALQDSNRSGDPGQVGEITDYRRNRAEITLTYRLVGPR